MLELNKVMLIGNLTRDPEMRDNSKATLASLRLAVNRSWKTKDGEDGEEVCFVDITVWGKAADFCSKYLVKGTRVYVEGRLRFEEWEKDGVKRNKVSVTADAVQFALPKGEDAAPPASAPAPLSAPMPSVAVPAQADGANDMPW